MYEDTHLQLHHARTAEALRRGEARRRRRLAKAQRRHPAAAPPDGGHASAPPRPEPVMAGDDQRERARSGTAA